MARVEGLVLSPIGEEIIKRGGHDRLDNDGMLITELVSRMPGLGPVELQAVFVAVMEEYGEDALIAVRRGYVKVEAAPAGARPEVDGAE